MLQRIKRIPIINNISKSFTKKLMSITLIGLMLGFIFSIAISNQGLIELKNSSVTDYKTRLDSNTKLVITSNLENIALFVENQIEYVTKEQIVVNELAQGIYDQYDGTPSSDLIKIPSTYQFEIITPSKPLQEFPKLIESWENAVLNHELGLAYDSPIFIAQSTDAIALNPSIIVKSAIWDKNRKHIMGILSYDLSTEALIKKVQSMKISAHSFAFLSQSSGNILAINDYGLETLGMKTNTATLKSKTSSENLVKHSFKDSVYKSVKEIKAPTSTAITMQNIQIEKKNFWVMSLKLRPFKTISSNSSVREEEWVLGFILPESDFIPPYEVLTESITKSSRNILLKQAAIILLLFAFITSVVFLIYEKMTKNLTQLISATEQIKKRNFEVSVNLETQDEFSLLAQSFNDMTSEIKATVQQLTAQNEILKDEVGLKIRMDEQIAYMKQYDSLTGLPNKQSLYRRLDEFTNKAIADNKLGALVVIGLDNFKNINEAYGMEVGDELLKAVAERLRTSVNADLASRITGDEFGVIFYGLSILDDLIARLDYLKMMMNQQFSINGLNLYMTASYGISSFPEDSVKSKDLVKYATNALMNAKENAKDHYRFYDSNIEQNIKNKVDLMNALRQCIEHHELKLVYQPITDVTQGKIVAVEALLRWHNSQFGYIPPNIFIPIAEEIMFISEIEKWVVTQVISDLELMAENDINDLYVSVNLSALDLESDDFMDFLEHKLQEKHIRAGRIQLEITEGVLINRYDQIVPRLRQLSQNGVRISLDDFGTGYSSLKYIKRLPIDSIKIDRSFVKDYPEYDDGAIAKIIVNLATTLNLSVIAEGVETKHQVEFLEACGCTLHQGYYYSKGIPIDRLIAHHKQEA